MKVVQRLVLPIYIINLTNLLMLQFALLLVLLSCLSYFDILLKLTLRTNPDSLIYLYKSTGLIGVFFYGCVQWLLW